MTTMNVNINKETADAVKRYLEAAGLEITHPYYWMGKSHDMWDQRVYRRYTLERKGGGNVTSGDWVGLKIVLGIHPQDYILEEIFESLEDFMDIKEYEEDDD